MNTNEIFKALLFAAEAHKDQRRKGNGGSPYINHLIEVADLLSGIAGVNEINVLQAAILHDILEDTNASEEELISSFGEQVTSYVKSLTDDKSLSLEERRKYQLLHVGSASTHIKLIKLADHCSNIVSIPPSWEEERIESYKKWSYKVASQCFGSSLELASEYKKRFGSNA